MKHFTLLCLTAILASSLHGQVIFESSFESWAGAGDAEVPTDWMGMRSSITAANVIRVTTDAHTGDNAVRLVNTGTASGDHRRFTTQDVDVVNGTTYTVSFWARGQGDIRLGLYDGRALSSGYAPYTPYTTVSSGAWSQYSMQVTAGMDASNAQFVLSVKSTVEPEHLVIDDVVISSGGVVNPPVDATIQEIQQTTAPDGASPLVGQIVNTIGVVTGFVGGTFPGFFIQDGSGPWSGIYVFHEHGTLVAGDRIALTGTVAEFNGQTQLTSVSTLSVTSSNNMVESHVITTAEAQTEPFESVLIRVQAATVTAAGSFGQFTVNDGSGAVIVDDVFYAHPFTVGSTYDITGVLQFAFSEWRILPRDVNDVANVTSIAENAFTGTRTYPNPAADVFTMELPVTGERTEYQLTDASGRIMASDVITSDRVMLDVSNMPNGLYALTLRGAGSVWSTRVVVAR
jgi:hypothetical protein